MPSYPLYAGEADAIAAYLETLTRDVALPATRAARVSRADVAGGAELVAAAGCLQCHALDGHGEGIAFELRGAAQRLERDWVRALLIDPDRVQPGTGMPPLFYERGAQGYRERFDGAGAQLEAIVAYLFRDAASERRRRDAAREVEHGRTLVTALGCAGCHTDLPTRAAPRTAPDLLRSAALMRPDVLRDYLLRPHAVRPFGDPPGSGARMPDFRLDAAEAEALASWLRQRAGAPAERDAPAALPRYAHATAETLLRERLPCLGCHALDGDGGRIAPELGAVGRRLEASAIAAIIDDPAAHRPGSVMPRLPLPDYERRRVVGYLAGRTTTDAQAVYLDPREHSPLRGVGRTAGESLYLRHCAACHGESGAGDGYNARFLSTRPTAHSDAAYMRERPDDALHDAIAVGGRIMGRSPAMPMFGEALPADSIRALVAHLRLLCRCDPPAWSVQP